MKFLKDKQTRHDFVTYAMCIVAFAVVYFMQVNYMIPRMITGLLVPITAYIVMAISLNLVVGSAGDLSLGHAGFMSVGAYVGIVTAVSLQEAIPSDPIRLAVAIIVGGAESEGVAVVAGGVGPVVDLQPVQRVRRRAGGNVFAGDLADGGADFGQRQTDDNAEQGGDHHQYHKTFQRG